MSHENDNHILGDRQPDHESYGMVGISRVQGRFRLFGSPIEPQHAIVLRVTEGHCYHGLGHNRFFGGDCILELAMSETQFAEMITTPNTGSGVPCTLAHYRDGDKLKMCEKPPKQQSEASKTREEFQVSVAEKMATMKSVRRQVDKLIAEAGLGAKRKKELADAIAGLLRLFEDSAPFFMEQFEENAEAVVAAAKAEISVHADHVLRQTGVAALAQKSVPMLEGE